MYEVRTTLEVGGHVQGLANPGSALRAGSGKSTGVAQSNQGPRGPSEVPSGALFCLVHCGNVTGMCGVCGSSIPDPCKRVILGNPRVVHTTSSLRVYYVLVVSTMMQPKEDACCVQLPRRWGREQRSLATWFRHTCIVYKIYKMLNLLVPSTYLYIGLWSVRLKILLMGYIAMRSATESFASRRRCNTGSSATASVLVSWQAEEELVSLRHLVTVHRRSSVNTYHGRRRKAEPNTTVTAFVMAKIVR